MDQGPIGEVPEHLRMSITILVGQLIEEDAEIDSVRVIATRVEPSSRQVQILNHVWGNQLLADAAIDLLNEREQSKYDPEDAEDAEG
tara:strand:+ start:2381 stop:2641 length:261 start_codon:yes stop_codon:yes gene_type:complete